VRNDDGLPVDRKLEATRQVKGDRNVKSGLAADFLWLTPGGANANAQRWRSPNRRKRDIKPAQRSPKRPAPTTPATLANRGGTPRRRGERALAAPTQRGCSPPQEGALLPIWAPSRGERRHAGSLMGGPKKYRARVRSAAPRNQSMHGSVQKRKKDCDHPCARWQPSERPPRISSGRTAKPPFGPTPIHYLRPARPRPTAVARAAALENDPFNSPAFYLQRGAPEKVGRSARAAPSLCRGRS
jgi:hypothetical protein